MLSRNPKHWLHLKRIVRFGDTDAAGVMHFHNLLRWAHEAWEESLECFGLEVSDTFPGYSADAMNPKVSLPIAHCQAEYKMPTRVGDQLLVVVAPKKIDSGSFQVETTFRLQNDCVAVGNILHVAINSQTRQRCLLPEHIELWLEASSINSGVQPL